MQITPIPLCLRNRHSSDTSRLQLSRVARIPPALPLAQSTSRCLLGDKTYCEKSHPHASDTVADSALPVIP